MILVVCCLYSFLGNSALTGVGPYLAIFSAAFGVSPTEASNLITYPSLAYGFGKCAFLRCSPYQKRYKRLRSTRLGDTGAYVFEIWAPSCNARFHAHCGYIPYLGPKVGLI